MKFAAVKKKLDTFLKTKLKTLYFLMFISIIISSEVVHDDFIFLLH